MKYRPVTKIVVSLVRDSQPIRVGRLALIKRSIYFEYDQDFLKSGIEISPFTLPLKTGAFQAKPDPFEGQSPGRSHLLILAKKIGIKPKRATAILDEVAQAVSKWNSVGDEAGVRKSSIRSIEAGMRSIK